jgi:hypothetical protein
MIARWYRRNERFWLGYLFAASATNSLSRRTTQGTFGGAVAVGENATARTTGVSNFAGAFGKNTQADTVGKGNLAISQGEAADAAGKTSTRTR